MSAILVVDDHPVFRRGMINLLGASGFDIAGEAASAAEAIELVRRLRPPIVLLDLGLPDRSGIDATGQIVNGFPEIRAVVVTMFDDDGSVRAALRAGACGYVLKDAAPEEIVAAVRAAELGAVLIGSGLAAPFDAEPAPEPFPGLTPRERQILDLLAKGLPNPIIAERLGLSGKTVANYVSVLLAKIGAQDRVEAAQLLRSRHPG